MTHLFVLLVNHFKHSSLKCVYRNTQVIIIKWYQVNHLHCHPPWLIPAVFSIWHDSLLWIRMSTCKGVNAASGAMDFGVFYCTSTLFQYTKIIFAFTHAMAHNSTAWFWLMQYLRCVISRSQPKDKCSPCTLNQSGTEEKYIILPRWYLKLMKFMLQISESFPQTVTNY